MTAPTIERFHDGHGWAYIVNGTDYPTFEQAFDQAGQAAATYRGYEIRQERTGGPDAYSFVHEDYDGAEDAHDSRHGYARNPEESCAAIDWIEDELLPEFE